MSAELDRIRSLRAGITDLGEWETRGTDVVIYDPNGFGAYRLVAHADYGYDAAFIAESPAAVTRLLAIVDRVELAMGDLDTARAEGRVHTYGQIQRVIRAAIAGEGA